MGVLPLQFKPGDSAISLGLTGYETFSIVGIAELPNEVNVRADEQEFAVTVRIDTPREAEYFRHGGILQYVLRQLLAA
jgi:aconitate hydratase